MVTAAVFDIFYSISYHIHLLPRLLVILLTVHEKFIFVYFIVSDILWRIDIDYFDLI